MNTHRNADIRTRLAGLGGAMVMTLAVLSGIGTLAETQAARPDVYAAAAQPQQVVVTGHRDAAQPQQVVVVGHRAAGG